MENFKWFISGFVAGEGCFCINFNNSKYIQATFAIKLGSNDKEILEKIKKTLGCGYIYFEEYDNRKSYKFKVNKIKDLMEKIIPFFEIHSFFDSKKQLSFDKWRLIVKMIHNKEHLTEDGLKTIELLSKNINVDGKSHK